MFFTGECIRTLHHLYGYATVFDHTHLEACPLRKTDLNSLDFVVNRFFMKLFQTSNIDIVKCCQSHFALIYLV